MQLNAGLNLQMFEKRIVILAVLCIALP